MLAWDLSDVDILDETRPGRLSLPDFQCISSRPPACSKMILARFQSARASRSDSPVLARVTIRSA